MSTLTEAVAGIEPANYRLLQGVVYEGSGIVLEQNKEYLFEARLSAVARRHGVGTVNDLCTLLRATRKGAVHGDVVEAMTTNETYFFREPVQYGAIRNVLLPELRQQRAATRKLRFWSAAASTGQEAYSMAMLLHEENLAGWNVEILGTDLSNAVLAKARAARYLQIDVNRGLPTPLLVKYFQRQGLDWELNQEVRRMARFEPLDLRNPMRTLGPFDAVFCRNVLIYFDAKTREGILREIHRTLFRGGWLLLGGSESPPGLREIFERRSVGSTIVYVAR